MLKFVMIAAAVGALGLPASGAVVQADAPVWVEGLGFRHLDDAPIARESLDFWGKCLVPGDVMPGKFTQVRTCGVVPPRFDTCNTRWECRLECPKSAPGALDPLLLDWPSTTNQRDPGKHSEAPAPVPLPSSRALMLLLLFSVLTVRGVRWLQGGHEASRSMTLTQAVLYYNDPRPEWQAYARQTFRKRLTGRPRLQSPSKKA